jgi:hypothetical protein
MDNRPLFQDMDEQERVYAPEELPEDDAERTRSELDEGNASAPVNDEPDASDTMDDEAGSAP